MHELTSTHKHCLEKGLMVCPLSLSVTVTVGVPALRKRGLD